MELVQQLKGRKTKRSGGGEHKPVRRGREMIDLLAVEEPKPKPAKIPAVSYEAAIDQLFKRMRSSSWP